MSNHLLKVLALGLLLVLIPAALGQAPLTYDKATGEPVRPISVDPTKPACDWALGAFKSFTNCGLDTGDTTWLLASAALVLIMTPALGFFYGGMVRRKNVGNIIVQCFIIVALVSVQWVLFGFSMAFGPDAGAGFLPNPTAWAFLKDVPPNAPGPYSPTTPAQAFMIFQLMFAIITPALIAGSFAERFKFSTFLVFSFLWATFVYDFIAHWVWSSGGWLFGLGALDFAGGTVIHVSSGFASMAAAVVFSKRHGFGTENMEAHNVPFVVLGAAFLWFGWFGFNAGSATTAGALATSAFVATNTAAAVAALAWMFVSWKLSGKPSIIGAASGAVAGLVAITPAAGFVDVGGAFAIGLGAGILCPLAARWIKKKLDDSLDVWACHGVGGMWGALATGLFANPAINAAGTGLLYGKPMQVPIQLAAIGASIVWSFTVTYIILKVLDRTMGLRVSKEEEQIGLDITQHGEQGYQ